LKNWFLPAVALSAPLSAFAVQYLTVEDAQKLMFPSATEFQARPMLLTEAQRSAIAQASDTRVRTAELRVVQARGAQGQRLGWVVIDEVLGKHDLITYAVALGSDGSVKQIEILDYRETYGGQIRLASWRDQFKGKKAGDALALEQPIHNISGATLSCAHVTDGIRRVLATYEIALKSAP
jgi:Na+-transporting NADH:ubiquinone oxidoreductase subunit NqrC